MLRQDDSLMGRDGLFLTPSLRYCSMMTHVLAFEDSQFLLLTRAISDDDAGDDNGQDQLGVATKTKTKPKKPSLFKVLLLNDDYTPMEFVVMVLKRYFNMDLEAATRVMLHVHQKGIGVCGIFPYEVAETKVNQVMDFAKKHQHPLQCTLEKA
jgi:ATP-dependent Clp protease adaptor protein ClpS